jgi:hypothetical protein
MMALAVLSAFESRFRRSHVRPASSLAKTPAAEIPIQSFSRIVRGSETIVCSTRPRRSGIPAFGRRMIGQGTQMLLKAFAAVPDWPAALPAWCRRRACHASNRATRSAKRLRRTATADRSRRSFPKSFRIAGGPVVARPFVSLVSSQSLPPSRERQTPAPSQSAPPAGPDRAACRVADDVIDRPAAAIRSLDAPFRAIVASSQQKRAFGRADEKCQIA